MIGNLGTLKVRTKYAELNETTVTKNLTTFSSRQYQLSNADKTI